MIVIKNLRLRRALKFILPFLLIPAVIAVGVHISGGRRYIFISLSVAVLSLLLFITSFEKKKIGTRRLTLVAVMTALSVLGRFIPFFKPVSALTVITAVYLGGESGFLTGALSALISDFWFGLGPWTPFQMFSWGMIGLIAGFLSVPLKKYRAALIGYGLLSGVMYSFIMDIWTVLWYNGSLKLTLYAGAILTALPHTLLDSVSNIIFLALFSKPFGEKLERIKYKYGV